MADAYGSGPYGLRPMKVQVLSPAPLDYRRPAEKLAGLFLFWARLRGCRASGASWPWRSCALERVIPVRFARGSDGTLGPSQVASKLRTGNFYLHDPAPARGLIRRAAVLGWLWARRLVSRMLFAVPSSLGQDGGMRRARRPSPWVDFACSMGTRPRCAACLSLRQRADHGWPGLDCTPRPTL